MDFNRGLICVLVPTGRRDTGTFLLRHASRPSVARSVADVLSAHGPRRKVPISRLGTVDAANISNSESKEHF